ncbi:T9SS type A sorting domain-containing protein [Marinoscillum sp. MHG1-6]|uniref:T9SS type A sorting domain-containing protein n=1 Tax=Marinoscillum sp. MHG1-6 TaxID=2959627 RepID=UPI0021584BC7|nr:T9SS type A sorting domain-containing protein [Marinoscillum sp. MHG1-6]
MQQHSKTPLHRLKNLCLSSLLIATLFHAAQAQEPAVAVDFNFSGRQEGEVHEPIFNSWIIAPGTSDSLAISGVEFKVEAVGYTSSWYKTAMQSPYFARLVSDGLLSGDVTIYIKGLKAGTHSFVAYHNTFSSPETNVFAPIDIYAQGVKIHDDLEQSNRVTANDLVATSYVEFTIAVGETAAIRYVVDTTPIVVEGKTYNSTVHLNGFKLNSGDPKRQAKLPIPLHTDEHANGDTGNIDLYWSPINSALSSNVYFGTSESALLTATTESAEFIKNTTETTTNVTLGNGNNRYYWRIDQVFDTDTVKGEVWNFKPRQIAFEGAEGYGRYAQGGRGGKVVHVTNLHDNGPGSLREAVETDLGPRTIIFDVSGIITLESRLSLNDDYVTVAGQTSPGKGICIRQAPFGLSGADDCIVQNIRVRLGSGPTYDGMGMSGCNHSIIDHCSISWTIDEAFSSRNGLNITLQRTLISEALNAAGHQNYPDGARHGYAATIGGSIGSFHHNLLAHNYGRNWSLGGGLDGSLYYAGELDIFNNVVYNWGGRATDGGAHEVNFVNNYYKKGAGTSQSTVLKAQLEGTGKGSQSYYYTGNILENTNGSLACDGSDNTCARTYVTSGGQVVDWEVFVNNPFFPSQGNIQTANDAYKDVLSDVGCVQPVFDDHDIRIINETVNGTFTYRGSRTNLPGMPDAHEDVGGWENYPELMRPENYDTDQDGLPDWWEFEKGLNSSSAENDLSDANGDLNGDGYTNLEDYLVWMGTPHFMIPTDSFITINMLYYTRGYTESPVFTVVSYENCTAEILGNDEDLKVTAGTIGLGTVTFKVTDAEGSSKVININFAIGITIPASVIIAEDPVDTTNTEIPVDTTDTTETLNLGKNEMPRLFPNPTSGTLMVYHPSGMNSIQVTNLLGEKVLEINTLDHPDSITIDVSTLSKGIYFILTGHPSQAEKMKFVKR